MAVVALLLVATFYADTKLRNRFGPSHSGQDIGGWRAGTSIPSFVSGTVAGLGWHKNYGYWVSIKISSTRYITFSHMLLPTKLGRGQQVYIGTIVGQVGASGAFADGFHVHVGYGSKSQPYGRPTYDPLPLIRKGTKPAAVTTKPLPTDTKDDDMTQAKMIHYTEGTVHTRGVYVPGTGWFVKFTESANTYANALAGSLGTGNSIGVTKSLFAAIEAASAACRPAAASTINLSGLKVPTAAENGAAARDAIVKPAVS